ADQIFGGTNLLVFMGQGPVKMPDGTRNPQAKGVLLSAATIGVVKFSDGTYAMHATGTLELAGFSGLTFTGTGTVDVNNSGRIVSNRHITIPSNPDVVIDFPTTAAVKNFTATGVDLSVGGQILHGNFSFNQGTTSTGAKVLKVGGSALN